MKHILYVLRYLVRARGNNLIKVVSIALGLGVGVILLSQVAFEKSFDRSYPGADRIYRVQTRIPLEDGAFSDWEGVVAPLVPALRNELPEIESGTIFTTPGYTINASSSFNYRDRVYVCEKIGFADSLFFEFFGLSVLQGDPKKSFGDSRSLFLARSLAEKIFGNDDPVGRQLLYNKTEPFVVAGVFEDFPANSHLSFEAVMPLANAGQKGFYMGWEGGGRYRGYVRLAPGTDPEKAGEKILDVVKRYVQDPRFTYSLLPVTDIHFRNPDVGQQIFIRSMLAFIVMFVAAMNYVLAAISSLASRARTMAMYKCNGSTTGSIFRMMIGETAILILLSILLAALLFLAFRNPISRIIVTPFFDLFAPGNLIWSLGIIVPLFLLAGFIPARIFSTIPVALAFRYYTLNKRLWKQFLLFVQFTGAAALVALIAVVAWQYHMMVHKDIGYRYDDLAYAHLTTITPERMPLVKSELSRLPDVESVSFVSFLPVTGFAGASVLDSETGEAVFDCQWTTVDEKFIPMLEIGMKYGTPFTRDFAPDGVVVNEEFVKAMGWTDNPVGKTFAAAGDFFPKVQYRVIGVAKNFYTNSLRGDLHPLIIAPSDFNGMLLVRLNGADSEKIAAVNGKLNSLFPDMNVTVLSYKNYVDELYSEDLHFRNTVLLGVIVTLLIALIGIIGYTNDEIQRRGKEIAIRKVNGATAWTVIRLIAGDVRWTAAGGVIAGLAVAYCIGNEWLMQFTVRIPLGVGLLAVCGIFVLLVVFFTITLKTWRIANENPIFSIRKE